MDEKPAASSGSGSDTASLRSPILSDSEKLPPYYHDPAQSASYTSSDAAPPPARISESAPVPVPRIPTHQDPVPDGGLQAWLQVLGSWVVLADTWGLINSFGVFQTYYEQELLLSSSAADISWIGSLQGALLMMVGAISGPLYDAGYFREQLWVGLFLIVFGQFMTSVSTQYWQVLLAQGVCIGIGCGLTFLPSTTILAQYFLKRRALVIGIASTGSPLAGIIFPIIFGRLVPVIGFGWTTRVIAFILLGISAVPLAFMHTRVRVSGHRRSLIDATALRDVPFVLVAIGSFFAFLTLYVAFFYIQLFAVDRGLCSVDFSSYLVTFLGVGSIIGRVGPNYLADKIGSLNIWVVVTFVSSILMFAWLAIDSLGGLVAFALLYGLFSGALVSVAPSVVVGLSPDPRLIGTRMGMVFFLSGISILVGTPIGGVILGEASEPRWRDTIAYGAASLILGAIGFSAARFVLYRRRKELKA
jgi:MFS family permease